jgi:hypothetical protein
LTKSYSFSGGKGQDKIHPRTGHEATEYCTLSLTLSSGGVGGRFHASDGLKQENKSDIRFLRVWVHHRAGMDGCGKSRHTGIRFKSMEASVQSTTGSRGVRISCSNAGCTMFRGSVKSTGYPFHSPASLSLPLPCVTVCHHISTGLYQGLKNVTARLRSLAEPAAVGLVRLVSPGRGQIIHSDIASPRADS